MSPLWLKRVAQPLPTQPAGYETCGPQAFPRRYRGSRHSQRSARTFGLRPCLIGNRDPSTACGRCWRGAGRSLLDSAHVAIVALQGTLCGTHHSLAHLDLAWRHHVEATGEAEEMLQARLQEGCRFPPGKILHDLLQDECVACKRATKGISWRWRCRSP